MQLVCPPHSSSPGDCIGGPLGVNPPEAASVAASPEQETPPPPLHVDFPPLHLPNDFAETGVRALMSNTMLHVPQTCRLRMIALFARCWKGLAAGLDECGLGTGAGDEVSKRIELWAAFGLQGLASALRAAKSF